MHYLVSNAGFHTLIGVGGIGSGCFFRMESDATIGRNESRTGALLDVRDYCKLHIVTHYAARLLHAGPGRFRVLPVGKVGDDAHGHQLLLQMQQAGMDTRYISPVADRPTLFSVCFQYPDGSGGNITSFNSAAAELAPEDVRQAAQGVLARGREVIALCTPEVPMATRRCLLALAQQAGAFRVASFLAEEIAVALNDGSFELCDLVALNEAEAEAWLNIPSLPSDSQALADRVLAAIAERVPHLRVIISAGARGAFGFADGRWSHCPAHPVSVVSTAGAGDALLGGVIASLVAGVPLLPASASATMRDPDAISSALELGVLLASFKVTSPHSIHPDADMDSLIAFAGERGLQFSPELVRRIERTTVSTESS